MSDRTLSIKRILPWVALIGGVIALACAVALTQIRNAALTDTGVTRPAVVATLDRLQALQPGRLEDPAFQQAVKAALDEPYVATVWLFAPDGQIVWAGGSTAQSAPAPGTAAERATAETRRILATLPEETLSAEQRTLLLAASAIQAEGEHNDVYRHLVRPIAAPDGTMVALVGIAYDVSDWAGTPSAGWVALLAGGLGGFGLYWLALPLWVWLDARQRGERAWVWAVFVLIGNLVALLAYLLVRPPRPA